LWDLSLVDPDNRRPVDYEIRSGWLKDMVQRSEGNIPVLIHELLRTKEDGRIKLFLIYKALKARKENQALFKDGDYVPLKAEGLFRDHVISFARKMEQKWAVTVAPRFFFALSGEGRHPLAEAAWKDTEVLFPQEAPQSWKNALTGEKITGRGGISVAEILRIFPAALLICEGIS
jgi:(1->4)-alpha-D-glucan 1-alpha-D-glucosylmutase